MKSLRHIIAMAVTGLMLATQPAAALTPEEESVVDDVEAYLNQIGTVVADFVQVAPSGALSSGKFFLSRPGKLRWQYDPPTPILIVSNGNQIIYYDFELEEVSRIGIEDTLAGFLARKQIDFNTPETRLKEVRNEAGVVRVAIESTKEDAPGGLTLIFTERPLTLRKLEIADAEGKVTNVSLNNMQFGTQLDPDLFVFHDPRRGGRRYKN